MADTYPEHEKLKALNGRNQTVGDFLEWLDGQGLGICEMPGAEGNPYSTLYIPSRRRPERLIADFFEIDPVRLEAEKRAMLDSLRSPRPAPSDGAPRDEGA